MSIAEGTRYIAPDAKILAHPELIQKVKDQQPTVPTHFEVDLTLRCNLACEGCHFAYTHTTPSDTSTDMPPSLWDKISTDMVQNNVKAVTFTGGGEPLFNPNHLAIFETTAAKGIAMGLYTNGVLLSGDTAKFVGQNFDWAYVSLDATTPEEYDEYKKRGPATFGRNVQNIQKLAQDPDRKATLGVGYLVHPGNLDRLDTAIPWLLDLGVDYVQMRPLIDVGTYQEQRQNGIMLGKGFESLQTDSWKKHYDWINQAREKLAPYQDTPGLVISDRKFSDLLKGKRDYAVCLSTSLSGSIGSKGEVWQCVNLRNVTQLGDLNTQSLSEIFMEKPLEVTDLTKCRLMCRNDQMNATLALINQGVPLPTPENVLHLNFI